MPRPSWPKPKSLCRCAPACLPARPPACLPARPLTLPPSPSLPVQAIDPAQFQVLTKWVAVSTRTPSPVANFVFRSDCWNGGYEGEGSQVDASLQNSIVTFNFADRVGGRVAVFRGGSSGNIFAKGETGEVAAGGSYVVHGWLAGCLACLLTCLWERLSSRGPANFLCTFSN